MTLDELLAQERARAAEIVERSEFLPDCRLGACDHDGIATCLGAAIRAMRDW